MRDYTLMTDHKKAQCVVKSLMKEINLKFMLKIHGIKYRPVKTYLVPHNNKVSTNTIGPSIELIINSNNFNTIRD